jgi:hypothetical protein
MRSRVTGLFLAVILLAAAVPAVLGCCLHPPDHGTPRAAVSHSVPAYPDGAVRRCVDRAAPMQNPYIETTTTGRGSAPASARGADATVTRVALPITAARTARRTALTADGTGPPLWLSTCVSRT